jgi:hypothetical protein
METIGVMTTLVREINVASCVDATGNLYFLFPIFFERGKYVPVVWRFFMTVSGQLSVVF